MCRRSWFETGREFGWKTVESIRVGKDVDRYLTTLRVLGLANIESPQKPRDAAEKKLEVSKQAMPHLFTDEGVLDEDRVIS